VDFPKTCPVAAVSLPSCHSGDDEAYDTSTRARNGLPSGLNEGRSKARGAGYNMDICGCKECGGWGVVLLLLLSSRRLRCDCKLKLPKSSASDAETAAPCRPSTEVTFRLYIVYRAAPLIHSPFLFSALLQPNPACILCFTLPVSKSVFQSCERCPITSGEHRPKS
jgi:hypothetical protein